MAESEQPSLEALTLEAFQKKLAELLVTGSLYRRHSFDPTHTPITETGTRARLSRFPKQLKMYCDHSNCCQETIWENADAKVYFRMCC